MSGQSNQRQSSLTQSHEERIRELWETVDELRKSKQNKLTAVAWVPLLVYVVSLSVAGLWGAATLSANMKTLTATVSAGTSERYHISTAKADFALRDKDIAHNTAAIAEIKAAVTRIERNVDRITDHIEEGRKS